MEREGAHSGLRDARTPPPSPLWFSPSSSLFLCPSPTPATLSRYNKNFEKIKCSQISLVFSYSVSRERERGEGKRSARENPKGERGRAA